MKQKTISGHYGTSYSISHNNRIFVPRNVDPKKISHNYNCIAAGQEVEMDLSNPVCLREFWARYRALSQIYWSQRTVANTLEWERYQEQVRALRRICWFRYPIPSNGMEAMFTLFLLPLILPCGIYLSYRQERNRREFASFKMDQWVRDMAFFGARCSLRDSLKNYDQAYGGHYLEIMDSIVTEMSQAAANPPLIAVLPEKNRKYRFASVEEIYEKVFQPAFAAFQEKQRPSRRYSGKYLEQIRERQKTADRKGGRGRERQSAVAEAYEIVFTIGDMDNTGYQRATVDAHQSEELLKDFCDHLRDDPHICFVTTRELEDPNWAPPFRHGLIAVNLVTHCDEATPGVHFTFIPYT